MSLPSFKQAPPIGVQLQVAVHRGSGRTPRRVVRGGRWRVRSVGGHGECKGKARGATQAATNETAGAQAAAARATCDVYQVARVPAEGRARRE